MSATSLLALVDLGKDESPPGAGDEGGFQLVKRSKLFINKMIMIPIQNKKI